MKTVCHGLACTIPALFVFLSCTSNPSSVKEAIPSIQFASQNVTVYENAPVCTIFVELSIEIASPVTVDLEYDVSSTAKKNIDFTLQQSALEIVPYTTRKMVVISLLDDSTHGSDKRIGFNLVNVSVNAVRGWKSSCDITILDDEGEEGSVGVALIDLIKERLSALRALAFSRPVRIGYLTREEYAASIRKNVNQNITDLADTCMTSEYYQLGLVSSPDVSAREITIEYQISFPIAYYLADSDSLFLVSGDTLTPKQREYIVAHELTHALQDQHGRLKIYPFPIMSSFGSDAYIARRALIEGEANLLEALYAYTYLYPQTNPETEASTMFSTFKTEFLEYKHGFEDPAYLSGPSNFPYAVGPHYVLNKKKQGWAAVDNLYSQNLLPLSTAEIILDSRIFPVSFDFNLIHEVLLSQFSNIVFYDDDTMGPLILMAMFKNKLDLTTNSFALGWTGDRLTYIHQKGKKAGSVVWAISFTDSTALQVISSRFRDFLGARKSAITGLSFVASPSVFDSSTNSTTYDFSSGAVESRMVICKNRLWWIDNAGEMTDSIHHLLIEDYAPNNAVLAKGSASSRLNSSLNENSRGAVREAVLAKRYRGE